MELEKFKKEYPPHSVHIKDICNHMYDMALHGEHLYFDFNGVRIIMYPKKESE